MLSLSDFSIRVSWPLKMNREVFLFIFLQEFEKDRYKIPFECLVEFICEAIDPGPFFSGKLYDYCFNLCIDDQSIQIVFFMIQFLAIV